LLLLQQLQELLVRFELHVRDVLVLQTGFEVVLGLTRFLDEFFLCYPSLFPLEVFLPQQRLLNALLNLFDVFKFGQPRDLLQPYPLLEHLLLLHLHLPLPLELSRPCCLLLSADALLIRQHLLGFQTEFFEELGFTRDFVLFLDDFLSETDLRVGYLVGVTGE
jgi:hypothetical protein